MDEDTSITITMTLRWSPWVSWHALAEDARGDNGIRVPNYQPGVYEVKRRDEERRLTIGKASDLRRRIKQGLVKGQTKHSSGTKIRRHEDLSKLVVRWATCDSPAAAEEELHKRHRERFGELPEYTEHT